MHKELPTFSTLTFLIIRNINIKKVGKTLCELFFLSVPESVVIQYMKNFHTIETIKIIDQAYQFSILVRITKSQHLIGNDIYNLFHFFFSRLPFQRAFDAMLCLQPIRFGA